MIARVHDGQCLVDVRCVPEDQDELLAQTIRGVQAQQANPANRPTQTNPAQQPQEAN